MKLIAVDPALQELSPILDLCEAMPYDTLVGRFETGAAALCFAREHPDFDLVLLETVLPDMSGLELAAQLRSLSGAITVFVTSHPELAVDALRQKADYVVFKPISAEDAIDAMRRARMLQGKRGKPVFARTFGTFDLQAGGKSIRFRSAKAKELMALLVCYAGKPLSIHEIVDCLWESDEGADVNTVGYRKAIKKLTDTLSEYGLDSLLERTRGYCRLNIDLIDSDYFGFVRGDEERRQEFRGVFLPEYAWAEHYIYPMLEIKSGAE